MVVDVEVGRFVAEIEDVLYSYSSLYLRIFKDTVAIEDLFLYSFLPLLKIFARLSYCPFQHSASMIISDNHALLLMLSQNSDLEPRRRFSPMYVSSSSLCDRRLQLFISDVKNIKSPLWSEPLA